jgi:hypothetical protein
MPMQYSFLKSLFLKITPLYKLSKGNLQKIIFTIPFLILTKWELLVSLIQQPEQDLLFPRGWWMEKDL